MLLPAIVITSFWLGVLIERRYVSYHNKKIDLKEDEIITRFLRSMKKPNQTTIPLTHRDLVKPSLKAIKGGKL